MKDKILIVDDDINITEYLKEALKNEYSVKVVHFGKEAVNAVNEDNDISIVLLDLRLPDIDGLNVLKQIKEIEEKTTVIMITADKDVRKAIEAIKSGAFDYIIKPFNLEEIRMLIKKATEHFNLKKEVESLKSVVKKSFSFNSIIGNDPKMQKNYEMMNKVLNNRATVLIQGESGTGKELVAKAVHYNGNRSDKPFVVVNCAAIPETLIESELFGYEKGAFTGATARKLGKFEVAHKGTLFLDEIGTLKFDVQSKLLRALEEQEIERIGGVEPIKIDVRIVCATNLDLENAVKEGKFREDLYYRIKVVTIYIPSLRERAGDIPFLVKHFINKFNKEYNKNIKISEDAIYAMMKYQWPGNIRELENLMEMIILMIDGNIILPKHLPEYIREVEKKELLYGKTLAEVQKEVILNVLNSAGWNKTKTSKILGITRRTLSHKIKSWGIIKK